jgi:hypothetical protein
MFHSRAAGKPGFKLELARPPPHLRHMMLRLAAACLLSLSGCKEVLTKTAAYEPQKAGSIDQAMCSPAITSSRRS